MQQPRHVKGVWEITAVDQKAERVRVIFGFLRSWSAIVRTTCHALGIDELPEMEEGKEDDIFFLYFNSVEDAKKFAAFADRNIEDIVPE